MFSSPLCSPGFSDNQDESYLQQRCKQNWNLSTCKKYLDENTKKKVPELMWLYNIVLKLNPFQSKNGKVIDNYHRRARKPRIDICLLHVYTLNTMYIWFHLVDSFLKKYTIL